MVKMYNGASLDLTCEDGLEIEEVRMLASLAADGLELWMRSNQWLGIPEGYVPDIAFFDSNLRSKTIPICYGDCLSEPETQSSDYLPVRSRRPKNRG